MLWLCLFQISSNKNTLDPSALKVYGRYSINNEQGLELISSAVHFGFSFDGTECSIDASIQNKQGHNYLQYELDGQYQKRIKITGSSTDPISITAQTNGRHTVWIYKATEAHTGGIFIRKIAGDNLKPVEETKAPLIEFIGNSITCGAAADASEVPCGNGQYHDQHNAYMAYGPRVARLLGTGFILSSVSGIGMYRNWNSDSPTMPQVYEKVDFQDKSQRQWNFALFTPQVVSIALGTNDFSNGDGIKKRLPFDSSEFVNRYVKFVELVKSKYPKAQIALLSSAMVNGNSRAILQRCLITVKERINGSHPADKKVATYFFQPMQPHGCSGHPSVEDHAILAKELVPFFKKLLR
ncbi:SGNH/GDSL hydrolase family protein [Segetibacter aerophilus]|uniref:Acetylxylan esterase n=1 Tax=Segetibacter aerophilus TaxID=670293 RepID=A0A512B9B3_9BACT|nr:SGNH/GDSL hydrolase family protein [Segetibacter aerophilus]GEO08548.1 acetylxylan esterase [Segetibacter aerophilus]